MPVPHPLRPSDRNRLSDLTIFGVVVTMVVVVVGGVVGYLNAGRLVENNQRVAHTHEVIALLETLLSTMKDAESGQRGYLLVEDEKYLKPYHDAIARVGSDFDRVRVLTRDNQEQQNRLEKLDETIRSRLDIMRKTVDVMRGGDHAAALDILRSGVGRDLMLAIREQIGEMQTAERILLKVRAVESSSSYRTTVISLLIGTFSGVVLVAAAFYLAQRNLEQRQRAAVILEEEKERLRTTLASIGDGVITTDIEGRVTNLNGVAEQLTGWTADDALGRPLDVVFQIVNEATRQPVTNPVFRAIQEGTIVGLANHTILISKDGKERPIDDSAAPIRCAQGQIAGCVLVFRDVTERHQQEFELQQRERQFRTLAESIPQLAWMANPDGYIFWYNRRWYDYTGKTFEEMQGWGWQSVHDPQTLPQVMDRWKASLATGEFFDMVFPLRGADGTFRPFLTRVEPVRDEHGRVARWFGTNTDIAEQTKMSDELRAMAARLSEADRSKDEFLATLAHELRNPLAPLRNGLQIMRLAAVRGEHGEIDEGVEQARIMMERQLAHMVRLVDDLLDVSRISRGKLDLRRESAKLTDILNNAIETTQPVIDGGGHKLKFDLPAEPIYLNADVTRLGQVFANLLNNAAKYSDRGGTIVLSVRQIDGEAIISIRDSGIGIPSEMLPKIFDLFTQVDRSLERSQGGLGIGLTLVKRLVEMHGGSVEARSEGRGSGSEFLVRLPTIPTPQIPTVYGGTAVQADGDARHLRILVADDNEDSVASLAMMLRITGHQVRTANNGQQAVDIAADFRPDVILLDIGMPKLNGYEACRRIRELPRSTDAARPTIIALTGWGQEEDKRRSVEAGFDHHLVKPVDPPGLEQLLAGLASGSKPA